MPPGQNENEHNAFGTALQQYAVCSTAQSCRVGLKGHEHLSLRRKTFWIKTWGCLEVFWKRRGITNATKHPQDLALCTQVGGRALLRNGDYGASKKLAKNILFALPHR